jgi:uncharacterized membrane protein YhaH (DUF805 family)
MGMRGSLERPPIVVSGDRRRAALVLLISLAFVGVGAFSFSRSGPDPLLYLSMAVFGVFSLFGLWMVIDPGRLEISPSGVSWRQLWRRQRVGWEELRGFEVLEQRFGLLGGRYRYVGLIYAVPPGASRPAKRRPRLLPAGWGMDTASLIALLERARALWSSAAATESIPTPSTTAARPTLIGGRIGRKAYWLFVAGIVAFAVALAFVPGPARTGSTALLVPWLMIYRLRLHDIGLSGWWAVALVALSSAPPMAALLFPEGAIPGLYGLTPIDASIVLSLTIQLVFTAWLGFAPGVPGPNRYGLMRGALR